MTFYLPLLWYVDIMQEQYFYKSDNILHINGQQWVYSFEKKT